MSAARLLVIDDDPSLQKLFRILLTRAGFDTDFATDGAEGLAKLAASEYDAIILDLMMPKMTGLEVLAELALKNPAMLRKVIVASSANQRMLAKVDCSTIHALIRKPFDIDQLVDTTRACARHVVS